MLPASAETVASGWMHQIDVADPQSMKERLDPVSMPNFLAAAHGALARSGKTAADVGALGIPEERTVYLDTWGHMSALDPAVALHLARESGRLKPGTLVLLLSAGTGYSWGASCIEWGT